MEAVTKKNRIDWVDYAKGICIFAVVCLYSAGYTEDLLGNSGFIQYWVDFARPFRMPDFFLLSGLFLAKVIDRPWQNYLDKKVVHYLYFFGLWTFINISIMFATGQMDGGVKGFVQQMWFNLSSWPFHMLWFIQMLPLYFLFTRFVRPVPIWFVLIVATLLHAFPLWHTNRTFIDEFFHRYVFFFAGYAFAPYFFKFASWVQAKSFHAIVLILGWIIVNSLLVFNGYGETPIIEVMLGMIGAMGIIAIAALASKFKSFNWLKYLGKNSIVVYLAFYWPMFFAGALLVDLVILKESPGWFALLITAIGIISSVALFRMVGSRHILNWLFKRPNWVTLDKYFKPNNNHVGDPNGLHATIEKVSSLTEIADHWKKIKADDSPSYFISWSWMDVWSKLVLPKSELYLFRCKDGDKTVAMCFLSPTERTRAYGFVNSRQLHINELITQEFDMVAQYNDLMVDPDYRKQAWETLFKCLEQFPTQWDETIIRSAPLETLREINQQLPTDYRLHIDRKNNIWRVNIGDECNDMETLISRFKSKSRRQLKRSIKEIKKHYGEINIELAEDLNSAKRYLKDMAVYHEARWEKAGQKGVFAHKTWQKFHNALIDRNFSNGEVLLFRISAGEKVLGYVYGHRIGDVALLQQTGFMHSEISNVRPGYVSHLFCMLKCAELGLSYYDFLPDDGRSYKRYFCESSGNVFTVRIQQKRLHFWLENIIKQFFHKSRKTQDNKVTP